MKSHDNKMNTLAEGLRPLKRNDGTSDLHGQAAESLYKALLDYGHSILGFKQTLDEADLDTELVKREFSKCQRQLISAIYFFDRETDSLTERNRVRDLFISVFGEYLFLSPIIRRAYEKPRGYPGDYMIFEMIYNKEHADHGMGYVLDRWILNHTLTRGTIYRKNRIRAILEDQIRARRGRADVLNLGCGSSREIRELLAARKVDTGRLHITCLDQDEEALELSEKTIHNIGLKTDVSFIKQDIVSICLNRDKGMLGRQDIIYSLGIADDLFKTTLENFIMYCYNLLKPRGKFIIALCSAHNPKLYIPLRWFADWTFNSHNSEDIRNFIVRDIGIKKVDIIWENRKPVFFVVISK